MAKQFTNHKEKKNLSSINKIKENKQDSLTNGKKGFITLKRGQTGISFRDRKKLTKMKQTFILVKLVLYYNAFSSENSHKGRITV